jgi:hypothetical protein
MIFKGFIKKYLNKSRNASKLVHGHPGKKLKIVHVVEPRYWL